MRDMYILTSTEEHLMCSRNKAQVSRPMCEKQLREGKEGWGKKGVALEHHHY